MLVTYALEQRSRGLFWRLLVLLGDRSNLGNNCSATIAARRNSKVAKHGRVTTAMDENVWCSDLLQNPADMTPAFVGEQQTGVTLCQVILEFCTCCHVMVQTELARWRVHSDQKDFHHRYCHIMIYSTANLWFK
jgi:hypothetical protein